MACWFKDENLNKDECCSEKAYYPNAQSTRIGDAKIEHCCSENNSYFLSLI
ncbi:hypothetical protein [Bartonella sp. DGB1]|uniref:hypothetical protein n=1 Tax=Bartonella sp. DGB1 TaxID=3239807 RepID=UPI003523E6BB